jgi:GNAT superfamily N-acetyltransferase
MFCKPFSQPFTRLVQQGGEVDDIVVARNTDAARQLVFLRRGETLIGIAALKLPQVSYRKRISDLAGVNIPAETFPSELGYVFVIPTEQKRGFSRILVKAVIEGSSNEGIYATSRADNVAMHRTLERFEFRAAGKPYPGRDQAIQLFVRDAR